MITRRRFIAVAAAFAAHPAGAAAPTRWHGRALGAEASLSLEGPPEVTGPALDAALGAIARAERLFSLYRADSDLVRLNRTGRLRDPDPAFAALLELCDRLHEATGGLFDPTVQPLWRALSEGGDVAQARRAVGWTRVRRAGGIALGQGQALTLNGIAQGAATDMVAEVLRAHGLHDIHVDIGEQVVGGRPRRFGILDPRHGAVGALTLRDGAVATSSPGEGPSAHIVHPRGDAPHWSTVTVEAGTAALADGLSTALCLADRATAARLRALPGVRRIVLIDRDGDLRTL